MDGVTDGIGVYTTYFARLKKLPENIVPISICARAPDWYNGLQYKKLAPKYDFFKVWKETHDNEYYIRCFNKQVLSALDPGLIMSELWGLVEKQYGAIENRRVALVCYERPEDFCHRHLVADWFTAAGYPCREWAPRKNDKN